MFDKLFELLKKCVNCKGEVLVYPFQEDFKNPICYKCESLPDLKFCTVCGKKVKKPGVCTKCKDK
jgi:hypothetical protein